MTEQEIRCPVCNRSVIAEDDPVQITPGYDLPSMWRSVQQVSQADRLFEIALALLALLLLISLLSRSLVGIVIATAMLWGIVTFQWWGYLMAMIGAGLNVFTWLVFFIISLGHPRGPSLFSLFTLAINIFILAVLYSRREHFE